MKKVEDLIGVNNLITNIVRDNENKLSYYFYSSKKFLESGNNDKYINLGEGPVVVFDDGKIFRLTTEDFYRNHSDKEIFRKLERENDKSDFESIISDIKQRKHINGDEFEYFLDSCDIDFDSFLLESEDGIYEKIVCSTPELIVFFEDIFKKCDIQYYYDKNHNLIFKNN